MENKHCCEYRGTVGQWSRPFTIWSDERCRDLEWKKKAMKEIEIQWGLTNSFFKMFLCNTGNWKLSITRQTLWSVNFDFQKWFTRTVSQNKKEIDCTSNDQFTEYRWSWRLLMTYYVCCLPVIKQNDRLIRLPILKMCFNPKKIKIKESHIRSLLFVTLRLR